MLKNDTVISTVDSACLALVRSLSSAVSIDLPAPSPAVHFDAGDTLSLRVSARRAVGCAGHNSGVFRLHYNRSNRASNFGASINSDADLSITKTDTPDPVTAGEDLTYTSTVTNSGPNNATGVVFSDPLPAGVTLVSATPSQGAACTGTSSVSCSLATINAGDSATVTIVVNVDSSTTGSLSNTASVTATQPDPTTPNTSTAETTVVTSADLSVTKTDGVDVVTAGDGIPYSYLITVTNDGPSDAVAVSLGDTWPSSFDQGSITTSQGSCLSGGGDFTCDLATIAAGGSATVTVAYTVPAATPAGDQANTATVGSGTTDPDLDNNEAADTTWVEPSAPAGADLSVTKTDSPDPVLQGQELTYTVTVANGGPAQATGVTLTDTLPAGVTFVSVLPASPACSEAGGTVTCDLGAIDSGSDSVVTIKVKPGAAAADGRIDQQHRHGELLEHRSGHGQQHGHGRHRRDQGHRRGRDPRQRRLHPDDRR